MTGDQLTHKVSPSPCQARFGRKKERKKESKKERKEEKIKKEEGTTTRSGGKVVHLFPSQSELFQMKLVVVCIRFRIPLGIRF